MTTDRDMDALFDRLEREAGGGAPGGCLDNDTIAGWVEGRLPEDELVAARAHALACPACRELVGATAELEAQATATRPKRTGRRLAIAAAVLVAVGGAVWFLSSPNRATDESLQRAAERLAEASPELFTDFRPLYATERDERRPFVERGGLRVREPKGTILDPAPAFAWAPVAGATVYRVRVRDQEGRVVFETEASAPRLAYPRALVDPLPQGARFVVAVEAEAPSGAVRGSEAFRTLEPAAVERYRRGLDVIRRTVTEPERSVMSTHWALRNGLFAEALRLLPEDRGDEGPAFETRQWLRNRLGDDE